MPKLFNQKGFGVVEIILVIAIVALIGVVGYQAWQNGHKQTQTSAKSSPSPSTKASASPQATASPSSSPAQSYFTITQWGVRAPYSGSDRLTYRVLSDNAIAAISSQLAAKYADCATYGGGGIGRAKPGDQVGTMTAQEFARLNPDSSKLVNGYYYMFSHDQAACGDDDTAHTLQSQANDAVKQLVQKLESVN